MNELLLNIRKGKQLTIKEQILLIFQLSLPSILSQCAVTINEFIDASMVGRLGANESASIGLVSSTTWVLSGLTTALGIGFTVLIAQYIGASEDQKARSVLNQGTIIVLGLSIVLAAFGFMAGNWIPQWLGGQGAIIPDARRYLQIFSLFLPCNALACYAGGAIQSTGNMKLVSIVNTLQCVFNVFFNYIFIFLFQQRVAGAALGTGLAELISAIVLVLYLYTKSEFLHLRKEEGFHWSANQLLKVIRIGVPALMESLITTTVYIAFTKIIAPLGTIAIAANSFSITIEGICYMPGFGIGTAASTIIGQSIGARREDLTRHFGNLTVLLGIGFMSLSGILLYALAPVFISLLTPNADIQALSVQILRIEAFAEPMYGASIVCSGVFRGAGDTLCSSVLNFVSMWIVRIPFAYYMALHYGLKGAWLAMCLELCFRGMIFLIRLVRKHWIRSYV